MGGFLLALSLAIPLNHLVHAVYWATGNQMPGRNFLTVSLGYDGALAGFIVVVCTAYAAPARMLVVAVVTFTIGAALAWSLIGDWPLPYAPGYTWWPIVKTYLGGLAGVAFVAAQSRKLSV
jgi:hypothetical protein